MGASDYTAISRLAQRQQRLQVKLEVAVRDALDSQDPSAWEALRSTATKLVAQLDHLEREAMRA